MSRVGPRSPALLRGGLVVDEFVNADVIAQGLSAFDPEGAAIAAGRVMLRRLHELAEQRVNFAFETTLANRTRDKSPYSTRSAIIGSTRAARCPGTRTATSETMTINTTTAT
jgi:hypothetical protein